MSTLNFHDACLIMENGGEVVCLKNSKVLSKDEEGIWADFEKLDWAEFLTGFSDERFYVDVDRQKEENRFHG